ncbi:hypothetical protein F4775DRAFT_530909, partial [Biscogniauxia sp. FL1348]
MKIPLEISLSLFFFFSSVCVLEGGFSCAIYYPHTTYLVRWGVIYLALVADLTLYRIVIYHDGVRLGLLCDEVPTYLPRRGRNATVQRWAASALHAYIHACEWANERVS